MTVEKGVALLCWVDFYVIGTWRILGRILLRPSSWQATRSRVLATMWYWRCQGVLRLGSYGKVKLPPSLMRRFPQRLVGHHTSKVLLLV